MKLRLTIFLFAAALPLAAHAALSSDDTTYLTSAIQSQLGRYALASLAQKNGASPQIKSLANSIALQSTASTRTLTSIAKANGVPVPTGPSAGDSYRYSTLSGLHGRAFDQRFVQELSTDDQLAADNDKLEMSSSGDARLKSFAKNRYQALQKELHVLNKIHS